MSDVDLIGHMMKELVAAEVKLTFYAEKKFESSGGGMISGGFCDEDQTIEVSAKRKDWLLIFAHEYCHFKQWQEGIFDDIEMIAAYSTFDSWLEGTRELPPKMLDGFIRKMQWLEMENEHRTLALLEEFNVDFDREEYIKKSNGYLLSYEFCKRIRKWHSKSLYDDTGLVNLMRGDRLLKEKEFSTLPQGFEEIAIKCYDFSDNDLEDVEDTREEE